MTIEPVNDPRWHTAHDAYIEGDRDGEDCDATYHRRVQAAAAMWLLHHGDTAAAERFIARVVPAKPAPEPPTDRDLTAAEVAAILHCSPANVYQLIDAGQLKARDDRLPGRKRPIWRITPDALAAYRNRPQRHLRAVPDIA